MLDSELEAQILSLYGEGLGIKTIVRRLHSSEHRVRRILREHGVDTLARNNRVKFTHKHPYNFYDVMEQKGWSIDLVCSRLKTHRKAVQEWRRDGLSWQKADEVAIGMGFMPEELGWFDVEELV